MTAAFTGIVLAGGLGRRLGAPKATAMLAGRPLVPVRYGESLIVIARRR